MAAKKGGISIEKSIDSLKKFKGVKRRMDLVAEVSDTLIYDDFAHHPTAIKMSTESIREKYPEKKILGIVELGSNTMSSGYHKDSLIKSFGALDETLLLDHNKVYEYSNGFDSEKEMIDHIKTKIVKYDIILIMTNKDSQKFIKPILENFENK
jgi:UDP-N-acetylmuramate: L-alanyl-gamma-D-glutamyl-meso-diaminopimelate ligase